MDWANDAAVYLDECRESLVEHGADYDDPTIDAITQLLCDAEDSNQFYEKLKEEKE